MVLLLYPCVSSHMIGWRWPLPPQMPPVNTVRSRYKRQMILLKLKKKWPTRTGMEDSRPIFFCKRFSYNENALYVEEGCPPRTEVIRRRWQIIR